MQTYYSREITAPTTRQQGFQNFVQMIINQLEADNPREALLMAVDLLDSISGKSNPYTSVTQAEDALLRRTVDDLNAKHAKAMAKAITDATRAGIDEGRRLQKQETAKKLGLL